jgi:hypothetical protein
LSSKIEDFSDSTTEAALKKAEKEVVDYGVSYINILSINVVFRALMFRLL